MPVVPSWLLEPVWGRSPRCCRFARSARRLIRSAATGSGSPTGSFSKSCCKSPGSAPHLRRSSTRPARPPRSAAVTNGSRRGSPPAQADHARSLGPRCRPGPAGDPGRWLNHQGPRRQRVRRPQPDGPRQEGHEAIANDRRLRHPEGPGAGHGQQARLPPLAGTLDKLRVHGRCLRTAGSTWTPGTTPRSPAISSPGAT